MDQRVFRGIHRAVMGIAVAAVVVATASARQDGTNQSASGEPAAAPVPPQFTKVCGHCHESERIVETRRLRQQWEEVIEKMIDEGATGSNAEFTVVLDYLMSEFGRVNVNAAPPADLAQVLHLEPAAAQAIVEFRKAQGKFADFDALLKVPNAPVEALHRRRDAIVF
jgi:competence protein ComEA